MKISKRKDKIIVEIPYWADRYNPYMEKTIGNYPTLIGLICRYRKNGNNYDEIGFAHRIDMDYKGKDDQAGDFIVRWYDSEDSFKEKCKELKLDIIELGF